MYPPEVLVRDVEIQAKSQFLIEALGPIDVYVANTGGPPAGDDPLGFTREQTFYVGDSDVDMIFANNAGVAGIGASWGFRGAEELKNSNAACVAETAQDIYDFVMSK